jgi:hypothetical protein
VRFRGTVPAMETEEPGLVRYWFEFDLAEHQPPLLDSGQVRLDGGDSAYRLLGRGVGVTGYDEEDCLRQLAAALGDALPPTASVERNPVVNGAFAVATGNPAWRGVWFPPLNLSGPTVG